MMNSRLLAYLAGMLDADGSLGIKRNTYAMRVRGDASTPVFEERIGLHHVPPDIPLLLKDTFGGAIHKVKGYTRNARPGFYWQVTNRQAAAVAQALLPYLRLKRPQALILLNLRRHKELPRKQLRIHNGTYHQMPYGGPSPRYKGKMIKVRNMRLSPEALAYRERLFEKIKGLNAHGKDALAYHARKPRLI